MFILAFVISCFLITLPHPHLEEPCQVFSIRHDHAGLYMIEVKDGQLHYVRHSLKQFGEGEDKTKHKRLMEYRRGIVVKKIIDESILHSGEKGL